MNRRITYATQLANSLFALQDQNEQMFDLHCLIDAILGETTELNGFACTPTSPASLTVNVAPGQIYSQEEIDATDFGTAPTMIPADPRLIMKFAYTLDSTPFTFVPPVTVGDSRNDLIQIAFQEADGDSTGLSFFGGVTEVTVSTPTGTTDIPVANNSITNNVNVERLDNVVFNVKVGTPAPTGTQVTPTPDAGYTGALVITTTQGVSTITAGEIAEYPGAPFISEKLKDKISLATANSLYALKQARVASLRKTAPQTVTFGSAAIITFGTTAFDTGDYLVDAPANSFLPKIGGYYRISALVKITVPDGGIYFRGQAVVTVYKNGSNLDDLGEMFFSSGPAGEAGDVELTGSMIISANGLTDYFQLQLEQTFEASSVDIDDSYFNIEFIGY